MYKIRHSERNQYLAYLGAKTHDGTYTLLLLDEDAPIGGHYEWEQVPVAEKSPIFNLKAPSVDAFLVELGDSATFAWVAKEDYIPPLSLVELNGLVVSVNDEYLCAGSDNEPYVYFSKDRKDEWEFIPV